MHITLKIKSQKGEKFYGYIYVDESLPTNVKQTYKNIDTIHQVLKEGKNISIDGVNGRIYLDEGKTTPSERLMIELLEI